MDLSERTWTRFTMRMEFSDEPRLADGTLAMCEGGAPFSWFPEQIEHALGLGAKRILIEVGG